MNRDDAYRILVALANGTDPRTGESLPAEGPLNDADTVRALFLAVEALKRAPEDNKRTAGEPSASKPTTRQSRKSSTGKVRRRDRDREWTAADLDELRAKCAKAYSVDRIARLIGRRPSDVRSRLIQMGLIPAPLEPDSKDRSKGDGAEEAQGSTAGQQGSRWSSAEDDDLRARWMGGMSIDELATTHQRSYGAIHSRLLKLGLDVPMETPHLEAGTGVAWLSRMPSPIVGCWYLDHHWDPAAGRRSETGQLVYMSKTYDGKPGIRSDATRLGSLMERGARVAMDHGHFPLAKVDVVIAVPAYPPKEPFNLPDVLADSVRSALGIEGSLPELIKNKETPQAKTSDPAEVIAAYEGALRLIGTVKDKVVLLVDDVVRSGTTLGVLGAFLQERGAETVGAFVATKAERGMAP